MLHKKDIQAYCELLEVSPDINEKSLKRAYKKQIQKWHPDRHANSSQITHEAEEKTKEINFAYEKLLPYIQYKSDSLEKNHYNPSKVKTPAWRELSLSINAKTQPSPQIQSRKSKKPLWLIAIIGGIWWYNQKIHIASDNSTLPEATLTVESKRQVLTIDSRQQLNKNHIDLGDTLIDVYEAMGQPEKMDGDTWWYGSSKIYFKDGRVNGWYATAEHPLHTSPKRTINLPPE